MDVWNANDPPVPVCTSSFNVPEDTASLGELPEPGRDVTSVSDDCTAAGDGECDINQDVIYSVQDAASFPFEFKVASKPAMRVKAAPVSLDYETTESYTLTIVVRDRGMVNDGNGPSRGHVPSDNLVTDVNEKPVLVTGQTGNINETAVIGSPVHGQQCPASERPRQGLNPLLCIGTDESSDPGKFRFVNQYIGSLTSAGVFEADGASAQTSYTPKLS